MFAAISPLPLNKIQCSLQSTPFHSIKYNVRCNQPPSPAPLVQIRGSSNRAPWSPAPLHPWTPGSLDPWTPGLLDPGPLDPWTPGPLGPWTLDPWPLAKARWRNLRQQLDNVSCNFLRSAPFHSIIYNVSCDQPPFHSIIYNVSCDFLRSAPLPLDNLPCFLRSALPPLDNLQSEGPLLVFCMPPSSPLEPLRP